MDSKEFNKKLDSIFFKESVIPADASIVDPGLDSIDAFKIMVNQRLRGLKKSQVGTPHDEVPQKDPGVAVLDERNNPISVGTIKNQVQNFGPEGLSQIISKLSADMNKTDANGQPTSEYNQFVDSIKQDGLELILKVSANAGGVKMAPNGTPNAPGGTPATAEDPNKKEPGDELAKSLIMDPETKENSEIDEIDDLGDFDKNMQELVDSGAPMGSAQSFLDYFGFPSITIHQSFFKRGKWWASVLYNGSEIWATGETEELAKNEAISVADDVIADDKRRKLSPEMPSDFN